MPDTPDPVRWLLAFTKPRGEKIAEENLLRQGFECFAPAFSIQRRRRGRWVWVEEPLFPRYVFVGIHSEQSWAPIRSTLGVSGLVRFGGEAALVPSALVEELRREADAGPERHYVFKHGQAVRIVGTSYSSIQGVFQMQEGAERAQVLISLLGRPAVVTVPLSELVPE